MSLKSKDKEPAPAAIDPAELKEQIINEIKPKIQESFSSLKTDLLTDIKEEFAKLHKPETEKQSNALGMPSAVEGLLSKLSGSGDLNGLDLKSLLSSMPPPAPPPTHDMTKEEYFQQQKDQRNHQMLMTVLQLVLAPGNNSLGGGSGAAFQELMMRNMIDSVMDGTIQRKVMTNAIIKRLGQEVPADLGLMGGPKTELDKKAAGKIE